MDEQGVEQGDGLFAMFLPQICEDPPPSFLENFRSYSI